MFLRISGLRSVLVLGAGHGIGCALVERLCVRAPRAHVAATYRRPEMADRLLELTRVHANMRAHRFDPLGEGGFGGLNEWIQPGAPFDLVVNAIGTLHEGGVGPERALGEIDLARMQHAFSVNAFLTPLLAQFAKPLMARDRPSALVALSAKVGSIGDNRLGGWYSYRASKAALNMFVRTIALEYARSGLPRCAVLAIHPGTTATELSRPYRANVKHRVWSPADTADHVLDTIESASAEGTGLFKNWDGTTLPW